MPARRSPLRRIPVCFGEQLPPILRHHQHPVSRGLTWPWRPIARTDGLDKPSGGLWTSPAMVPPGKWRPIPRWSTWTDWCATQAPEWINGRWQTQLFPERDAVFAVIDSKDDARALYEAFPDHHHPVALLMRHMAELHPELRSSGYANAVYVDWVALMRDSIAGVYLTDRGMRETRHRSEKGVPAFPTWDAATVWFARPAYRIGKTWPSPSLDRDPYGLGWAWDGRTASTEDAAAALRQLLADLRGQDPEQGTEARDDDDPDPTQD